MTFIYRDMTVTIRMTKYLDDEDRNLETIKHSANQREMIFPSDECVDDLADALSSINGMSNYEYSILDNTAKVSDPVVETQD